MTLPTDYDARKALPLYDYMFGYFPDTWIEEVKVAVAGNQQHNPGERLHWARHKSTDQLNTAMRHIFDHGTGTLKDSDGCYHLAKAIWRLRAELQLIIEKERAGNGHDTRRASEGEGGRGAESSGSVLPEARAERDGGTGARLSRLLSGTGIRG